MRYLYTWVVTPAAVDQLVDADISQQLKTVVP